MHVALLRLQAGPVALGVEHHGCLRVPNHRAEVILRSLANGGRLRRLLHSGVRLRLVSRLQLRELGSVSRLARHRCRNRLPAAVWEKLVAFEKLLYGWPLEHEGVLPHQLNVVALEHIVFIRLLLVEVVRVLLRLVRGFDALLEQGLPVVISQPNVLLDFRRSVQTESVAGLSLQEFVDEVGGLERPSFR